MFLTACICEHTHNYIHCIRNNSFHSGYFTLNICRPNTFRCILVFVAKSSNYHTTTSGTSNTAWLYAENLEGRRLPPPATEQRPTIVKPPHFSSKPPNCFQYFRPQHSSLYVLTSVYITHIQTRNLQYFFSFQ